MAVDAGTNGMIYATFEPASVYALCVTNSLNAAITNGTLFAYVADGVYTNADFGAISSTTSNFVWNAVGSSVVDDVDTFTGDDGFSVLGWRVTPTQAGEIIGED
jgi:hypothetical protein